VGLFPGRRRAPGDLRVRARHELRRISLELAWASKRAEALGSAATRDPDLTLRAEAARVRVAALRARAAQLRRAAGVDRLAG
jgi:hypothetical protein